VNVYTRIAANQNIVRGGQYMSVAFHYAGTAVRGSITTPWSGAWIVPTTGYNYNYSRAVPTNWVWANVAIKLRYWNGYRWTEDEWKWITAGPGVCEVGLGGISG
jgi:hypothetical protein